jgi:putative hydrolase of the HAD superfamily
MIKAIGFDWGGVISGSPGREFDKQVSQLLGVTPDEFQKTYFSMNELINNGVLEKEDFWRLLLRKFGKEEKYDEFEEVRKNYQDKKQINQEVIQLVDDLRNNRYKVGLLTNNTSDARKRFKDLGVLTHFDCVIISAEVGLSKPDARIFELFTKQMGVNPQELVFIDDSENSLKNADEVGYTPVLYTGYEDLVKTLQQLEIL